MRKSFTSCMAIALMLFALPHFSFGQLSEGGTPPGFKFAPANHLPVISMPAINVDSLLAEDAINEQSNSKPFRFGYNHLVYFKPDNSGTWTELSNGARIWQLVVKAAGAYSINLAFSNFQLPAGAKLFVYSKDHQQVLGGFTTKNTSPDKFFGTELINGDEAVVEYFEPAAVKGQGNFNLFRVTQGYKNLRNYLKSFGQAGSCIHNINCPQYVDFSTQKRSVVCLVANGGEICSGALVNNTLNDSTPYILTAHHCGPVDGSWVFRFNWEAPGCSNPSTSPSTAQSVAGCSLVAQSGVSDFLLVKMNSIPPAGFHPFYAGWNHGLTPATSVTCIHHPSGDIKKCSQANNAVTDTFYDAGNGTALVWQIGLWTDGCTEPGSSGSPLFDQNKRIVGQLYGGPSACGATGANLIDFYGRFCVSWDSGATPQTRLKDWLDPDTSGAVTNDGFEPYPPQDSLDIALTGVVSPVDSICTDHITPAISVQNLGAKAISTFTVKYHMDGGADTVFIWNGMLLYLGSATVNLPAFTASSGQHRFAASVTLPNGLTDQNPINDSASSSFVIYTPTGINTPVTQGFESGTFPPTGWSIITPASGTTWAPSSYGAYGRSSNSVSVDEYSPFQSTAGETPGLITPAINMIGAINPAFVKFDVAYAVYDALHIDSFAVLVSTDCGVSWSNIYQKGGSSLATAPDTAGLFTPNATQWRTDSVDITNLVGQPSVLFKFQELSGYGNVLYLDNINIADTLHRTVGISSVTENMTTIRVFPNPFTENFNLQFTLDASQSVDAGLYSVDGKKIITVLNNEKMDAGSHHVEINTHRLSDAVYILKVNERFFKLEKLK